jgi:phosphoglucosamine mutase
VICDERGQVVDGDQIMALIASAWSEQGRLHGGGVVATVMSNLGLERFLAAKGLSLERTAVGDRSVMARMREGKFNLGGEASGHIIMSDYSTTGDGLIAALQVMAELVRSNKRMSALARQFTPVPQKLENVRFGQGKPLEHAAVREAIAAAETKLNGAGRLLVRASGTEPLIRIMAEGDDEKLVGQLVRDIAGAVRTAAAQ